MARSVPWPGLYFGRSGKNVELQKRAFGPRREARRELGGVGDGACARALVHQARAGAQDLVFVEIGGRSTLEVLGLALRTCLAWRRL